MTFALGARAARAGHRLIVHDTLDSTNSEALRLARSGERGPLWIVAREQTAGRGRRGREWISAPGNLATSLLCVAPVTPALAATLGFVASLAVHEACRTLAPGVDFALKWPNDVLADGAKVAGLLLESEADVVFARECLVRQEGESLALARCYEGYVTFCNQRGWVAMPRKRFTSVIADTVTRQFGITVRHDLCDGDGKNQRGWRGLLCVG